MQSNKNSYEIQDTSNPEVFKNCAKIMAHSDPWITLGLNYDDCLKAFDGIGKEVYTLKNEQELIGFVVLQTSGSFKGYIQTLAIDKAFRGIGYGTILLQFCENKILQYSPNVFICVSSFNTGALQLYKKSGFLQVGELTNFVKEGFTEILLRKTVGPINGYKYKNRI